jgi:S-adenosylmethionine:tRNA ribosyltransferase-isomerase
MKLPEKLDIREFSYDLPAERIARYPSGKRDDSKLLYYDGRRIVTHSFRNLPDIVGNEYDMVFNDTKVIQARLLFRKETGATVEILLLEPFEPSDYSEAMGSRSEARWICLVGNVKKWKTGPLIRKVLINNNKISLEASREQMKGKGFIIRFRWDDPDTSFSEIISNSGTVPIPPYLNRESERDDLERYQTIYSRHEGSVAAPTAGLHFTDDVLDRISRKGIRRTHLTLHVGAGTFIPVKTDDALLHEMHTELISAGYDSIEALFRSDKKHLAVGTTSVRSLESLYWIGMNIENSEKSRGYFFLDQWGVYSSNGNSDRREAMENIISYMKRNKLEQIHVSTKIMIVPGFRFRMTDGILTNFHQPESTLLLLIAAFAGKDWKKIYNYALNHDYRFLSYGDSSLLLPG